MKIIFTYEGYSYERMIIAAAKEVSPKISCIGYQHAGVFQSQNIIYKSFSPKYDPDYIFCTGTITADFCKKNIENDITPFSITKDNFSGDKNNDDLNDKNKNFKYISDRIMD